MIDLPFLSVLRFLSSLSLQNVYAFFVYCLVYFLIYFFVVARNYRLRQQFYFYNLVCLKQISCKIIVAEEKTYESINY